MSIQKFLYFLWVKLYTLIDAVEYILLYILFMSIPIYCKFSENYRKSKENELSEYSIYIEYSISQKAKRSKRQNNKRAIYQIIKFTEYYNII